MSGRYVTTIAFRCPVDNAHGKLLDMGASWLCPHRDHDGYRGSPPSRSYFSGQEAETGALAAVLTPVRPASPAGRGPSRASRPAPSIPTPVTTPSRKAEASVRLVTAGSRTSERTTTPEQLA